MIWIGVYLLVGLSLSVSAGISERSWPHPIGMFSTVLFWPFILVLAAMVAAQEEEDD